MSAWLEVDVEDHNYANPGLPVDFIEASYTRDRVQAGGGKFTLPYSSPDFPKGTPAARRIMGAYGNHVPVTMRLVDERGERDRFDGWVTDAKTSGPKGAKVVEVNVVDVEAVLRATLAWSAPILPLAVQPGYYIYVGPAITGILNIVEANARDRLGIPLQVIRPAGDASYLINYAARFPTIEDLIKDTRPEMEQTLTVRVWRVGDPQPAGMTLTSATILVEFLPMNTPPDVIFDETYGGVESEVMVTAPQAGRAIIGGKSPDWLNKALSATPLEEFFSSWGLSLKNIFLAYAGWDVPNAAGWGTFAPREAYVAGGGEAYTIDAIQAGRQAMVDLAGRRQVKLAVTDGAPFTYGRDYRLGTRVGALTELDTDVVWQQVTKVAVAHTRADGVTVTPTIGDDRAPQDWLAKLIGRVKNLIGMFQSLSQGAS